MFKTVLDLLKWKWWFTSLQIGFGAWAGNKFNLDEINLIRLLLVIILFQLFYGAIYINNDLLDYADDVRDPLKSKRPVASGKVSKSQALLLSLGIILIVPVVSYFVSPTLVLYEFGLLVYNLLYTIYLKKVAYLDAFANSLTHAIRVILGMNIFAHSVSIPVILGVYALTTSIGLLKRVKEILKRENGRKVLQKYSVERSKLINIILLGIYILALPMADSSESIFLFVAFGVHLLITLGFYYHKGFRERYSLMYDA